MKTTQLPGEALSEKSGSKKDFGSLLRSGILSRDAEERKLAAQHSLNLIKASADYLINVNTEGKIPDVDATIAVMKELNNPAPAETDKYPCTNEMLKELIKDHERIMLQLKKNMISYYEKYRDMNVRELLSTIIEEHRKVTSTLKRYLVG